MPLVRKPGGEPPDHAAPTGALNDLRSPDEELRWIAARTLPTSSAHFKALATALHAEPVARVREAMLTTLARAGSPESAAAVLPLLRSDDAGLRAGALDALRIMARGAPQLLPPLLADPDVDVRVLSCELARALPGDQATLLLCELLADEQDPNVCAAAIDVLAEVGQSEALPTLDALAEKFRDTPFLAFAIQVTADRIRAQTTAARD
jgi:HEAT repeat protein